MQLLPQRAAHTIAIDIDLPARALMLRYRRRIAPSARIGRLQGRGRRRGCRRRLARESAGEKLDHAPGSDRGERRASLELMVSASGNINYFPAAEAWVVGLTRTVGCCRTGPTPAVETESGQLVGVVRTAVNRHVYPFSSGLQPNPIDDLLLVVGHNGRLYVIAAGFWRLPGFKPAG